VSSARAKAEELLRAVGEARAELDRLQAEAESEMARVTARHALVVGGAQKALKAREKALIKHLKSKVVEVFDGDDTVRLESGVVTHTSEPRVRIPRDALERIKAAGWLEGIRVQESVDRGKVETWPDERLTVIGAERKDQEVYGYELADPVT